MAFPRRVNRVLRGSRRRARPVSAPDMVARMDHYTREVFNPPAPLRPPF